MTPEDIKKNTDDNTLESQPIDEWSGNELDEVPTRVSSSSERIIGMSEEQMREAAQIFGIIIIIFAAFGFSLGHFLPSKKVPALVNCVQIEKDTARLSCYDHAAESLGAPFKGASPFSTYSQSDSG